MNLFQYMNEERKRKESPLAMRLRPDTLEEIVGQEHILGKDKLLYRAIKADKLGSIIFYGPPGTGKTTIAKVIANTTQFDFKQINATTSGKKEMEQIIKCAKEYLEMYGKKSILFIDEIHRFNKAQQDYLLPFVEDGTIILIGATTENPYFEVNQALLSRVNIFELKPISKEGMRNLISRAIYDKTKGMAIYNVDITQEACEFLVDASGGDARYVLNAIELAVLTTKPNIDGKIYLNIEVLSECIQRKVLRYDREGENHYDTISAFIKSMRGSDPDAALYYLAKMLEAGEDIQFIARRIMICASEDVGNADPQALILASSMAVAIERIGMPEAEILLAQVVSYIATAPKSNTSILAIQGAKELVKKSGFQAVPRHLKDTHYNDAKKLERGYGYQYPHNYKGHYIKQQYLPDDLIGSQIYQPSEEGYEKTIREYMKVREEYSV